MSKKWDIDEDEGYEVGYGRPPRAHQFQKGRSGNPAGRPKGSLNIRNMVMQRLLAPVSVREGGKMRRISSLEAVLAKGVNDGLQGRPKPMIDILKFLHSIGLFSLEESQQAEAYCVGVTVTYVDPDGTRRVEKDAGLGCVSPAQIGKVRTKSG